MKKFFTDLDKTFIRFILVGVANTIFGTAVMFFLYNVCHMSYWISSAGNYVFGSILSFFLNKNFTFRSKERSVSVVLRFVLNISVCYFIAYGVAKPVATAVLSGQSLRMQENGAMLVGMVLFVFVNYFGQRIFVFRKRKTL